MSSSSLASQSAPASSSSASHHNPSPVFFYYGLFVLFAGFLAFGLSGFKSSARTALIVSSAITAVAFLLSFATSSANSEKTRRTFSKLGASLLLICACLFAWRFVIFPIRGKKKEKTDNSKKSVAAEQARAAAKKQE
jgi:hypothetical protein